MYNATEQFAEINKAGVRATPSSSPRCRSKTPRSSSSSTSTPPRLALAQGVEGAQAAAVGQGRAGTGRAARQARRSRRANRDRATRVRCTSSSSEAQAEFSALAEEAWASYTKGVAAWVDKASKNAPAGSDVAVNAFKSTFAASTAAFDQFQKATKQVVDLADASVRAAAANASKVRRTARRSALRNSAAGAAPRRAASSTRVPLELSGTGPQVGDGGVSTVSILSS